MLIRKTFSVDSYQYVLVAQGPEQVPSKHWVAGSNPAGDANLVNKKARHKAGFLYYMSKYYANLKLLVTTDAIPYDPVACNDAVYGPGAV